MSRDDLVAGGVPAPDLLRLARHVVAGRIAQAEEHYDEAVSGFKQATSLQNALPYLEPPLWYYPVSQSLGSALLQAGKPAQAEEVLGQSLEQVPNNGWALYGLMRARKAQGDVAGAQAIRKHLDAAWLSDQADLDLMRL